MATPRSQIIVYDIFRNVPGGDHVVYLPRERALYLSAFWSAPDLSVQGITWGDIQQHYPAEEFEVLMRMAGLGAMLDNTRANEVPAWCDILFDPTMVNFPQTGMPGPDIEDEMRAWIPLDIQRDYGQKPVYLLPHQDGILFPLAYLDVILARLSEHGYICVEDTPLVRRAYSLWGGS